MIRRILTTEVRVFRVSYDSCYGAMSEFDIHDARACGRSFFGVLLADGIGRADKLTCESCIQDLKLYVLWFV